MNLRWLASGEGRNHDRGPGRSQLGPLAQNLPGRRPPRFRVASAQRPLRLPERPPGAGLHRMLDLAGAGRGVDEDHRVRPDGQPDDLSTARAARSDGGGCRRARGRPVDPRRGRRLERARAHRVQDSLSHPAGALRHARGRHSDHPRQLAEIESQAGAESDPPPDRWQGGKADAAARRAGGFGVEPVEA